MFETEFILDERIFTVNCALNLCGYDDRNMGNYHHVRRKIRKSLKMKKLQTKKEMDGFLGRWDKNQKLLAYASYLSQPPEFKVLKQPKFEVGWQKGKIDDLDGVNDLLRRFYEEANIKDYWKTYKKDYEKYRDRAKKENLKKNLIGELEDLMRQELPFERVQQMVCLLQPHYRGQFIAHKDKNIVLTGPERGKYRDIYPVNLVHETIHPVIEPWLKENFDLIKESSFQKDNVPDGSNAKKFYVKSGWKYYVEEVIVRSMVAYLDVMKSDATTEGWIETLNERGFVHSKSVIQSIKNHHKGSQDTFEEYLPKLLQEIKKYP